MILKSRIASMSTAFAAALALTATGLAAGPAQASHEDATVTITVRTAGDVGIGDLDVYAYNDDDDVEFEETAPGTYVSDDFEAGEWTIIADDYSDRDQPYASGELEVDVVTGDENFFDLVLEDGANVNGTVTTPSGQKLKNIFMLAAPSDEPDWFMGGDVTATNGTYSIRGLAADTYRFSLSLYDFDSDDFNPIPLRGVSRTVKAGEVATYDLKGLRVPSTMSVSAKSSKKGKATITAKVNGAKWGISSPLGVVTVKEGKKTKKSKVKVIRGIAIINLSKLKKGKHTFTVYYGGGDVQNATKKITVKVK